MQALVSYLIVGLVLTPLTLIVLFYFATALRRSFQNWNEWKTWGDVVNWTILLILEVGSAGLYGFLLYWAIVALDRGIGF